MLYYLRNPVYLIINKTNGYFEEINKSKYLRLVPINVSKEKITKYKELWNKIRNLISSITKNADDLISSITKNSDDYDEKHMRIKFNFDYELPQNKMIEIPRCYIMLKNVTL